MCGSVLLRIHVYMSHLCLTALVIAEADNTALSATINFHLEQLSGVTVYIVEVHNGTEYNTLELPINCALWTQYPGENAGRGEEEATSYEGMLPLTLASIRLNSRLSGWVWALQRSTSARNWNLPAPSPSSYGMLYAWPVVSATRPVTRSPMIWAAPDTARDKTKERERKE